MRPQVVISGPLFLLVAGGLFAAGAEPTTSAERTRFFETEIQPILQAHCISCHGGEKTRSGLNLTSREGLLKGGERGPAVSLDKPDDSLLLKAVNQHDELKMPPKGKLAQAQIDTLARWVRMGAPWSEGTSARRHGPPP
ncbi:MAG TPA: c-type cytochrome domain-containing protein, partial [Gemmataceae bacterium]|nr:c-type cytochrome domain-containing protein [Gemmataceae bacterium]